MKLCFIGNIQAFHEYGRALAFSKLGHEVVFISTTEREDSELPTQTIRLVERTTSLGRLWASIIYKLRFFQAISRCKADAYVTVYSTGLGPWLLRASSKSPRVASVIGSDAFHAFSTNTDTESDWTDRILREAQLVVAESPFIARHLAQIGVYTERMITIPWGVQPILFENGDGNRARTAHELPAETPLIFAPRGFKDVYDPELTLSAFSALRARLPEARMVMLGDTQSNTFTKRIEPLVQELGLDDHVIFPGHISHTAMTDYYYAASVTLSTSKSDGTPTSMIESMACGTPVVMTELDKYEGIFIHAETALLTFREADDIAKKLHTALAEGPIRERLITNGRNLAFDKANFDKNVVRVEKRITELIQNPPTSEWPRYGFLMRIVLDPLVQRFHTLFNARKG